MTARRFTALVVLGVALMQAAWIAVLPPFRGIDEVDHVFRAAAVARGEWTAGSFLPDARGQLVTVPRELATAAAEQCWSLPYTGRRNCFPATVSADGTVRIASAAAAYNPPFYWLVGTVARPFHGAGALYAMRIATAVLCTVLIGAGAWCLAGSGSRRWRGIGLMIALTPVALFSTTVAAPNGPEIAAGVALWCALLGLRDAGPRAGRCLLVAGVAAAVLVDLRTLGPAFCAIIVVVCTLASPRAVVDAVRRHRAAAATAVLLTLAALGQHLAWLAAPTGPGADDAFRDADVLWDWSTAIAWQLGAIAAFPFRNLHGPLFVYPLFAVLLAWLWVLAVRHGDRRDVRLLWLVTLGSLAMPFVLTAATYDDLGVIWQGRYGLAVFAGVTLLAAVALDRWRSLHEVPLVVGTAVALCLINAASLVKVRHDELARPESAGDPAWHQPGPVLVVAVVALAWAALTLAASRTAETPEAPVRDELA